ncbi:hypothetical protein E2C01_083647 [Portunus trituberculatus]|uniref:Uncharacterized protein n=1 Tax=Portunus trituberculatus TaxID=210409 RepID=A0A5B7J742_PORTR|nr:hypothetical protein [Portunus trituberculatus]
MQTGAVIYRRNGSGVNEEASPATNRRQAAACGGDGCDQFVVWRWIVMTRRTARLAWNCAGLVWERCVAGEALGSVEWLALLRVLQYVRGSGKGHHPLIDFVTPPKSNIKTRLQRVPRPGVSGKPAPRLLLVVLLPALQRNTGEEEGEDRTLATLGGCHAPVQQLKV